MVAAGFTLRKIKNQPLLGQKLFKARKRLKVDLDHVEMKIKVRSKYLEALEKGDYHSLPSHVYVKGFLQSYSKFLGLKFEELYELYEKERKSFGLGTDTPLNNSAQKVADKVIITPKMFIWPSIAIVVIMVISYIFYQITGFASAPKLEVATPVKDMVIYQTEQMFEGSTDPDATLTINGQIVTVAADGHFKESIKLLRGLNTVELAAKNKNKKETRKICIIEVREQTALK